MPKRRHQAPGRRTRLPSAPALSLICLLCLAPDHPATADLSVAETWYVSTSGNDAWSGSGADSAWATLARAFDCANDDCAQEGDGIIVAAGTYHLGDNNGNGEIPFNPGVRLVSDQGREETILVADTTGARHFLIQDADTLCVIGQPGSGFTFVGGRATADTSSNGADGGGSIKIAGTSRVHIQDCRFESNIHEGGRGGAIYFASGGSSSLFRVIDCTFLGNAVSYDPSNGWQVGGGALFANAGRPDIVGCHFEDNQVVGGDLEIQQGSASVGGAYYSLFPAGGRLLDCTFVHNRAREGGAVQIHSSGDLDSVSGNAFYWNSATKNGGAMNLFHRSWGFSSSTFVGNTATERGGAVYSEHGKRPISNCWFLRNEATSDSGDGGAVFQYDAAWELTNCLFAENRAGRNGGAMYWDGSENVGPSDSTSWSHVTFVSNEAGSTAGGVYFIADTLSHRVYLDCTSSIFAFNSCNEGAGSSDGGAFHVHDTSRVHLSWGCINFYGNSLAFEDSASCSDCVYSNPDFYDIDAGIYCLNSGSPAADSAGSCPVPLGNEGLCFAVDVSSDTEISKANPIWYNVSTDTLRVSASEESVYVTVLQLRKSDFDSIPGSARITGAYLRVNQLEEGAAEVRTHRGLRLSTIMTQTNWYTWRLGHQWALSGAGSSIQDFDGRVALAVENQWPETFGGYTRAACGFRMQQWFRDYVQNGGSKVSLAAYEYLILRPGESGRIGFSSVPKLIISYVE